MAPTNRRVTFVLVVCSFVLIGAAGSQLNAAPPED